MAMPTQSDVDDVTRAAQEREAKAAEMEERAAELRRQAEYARILAAKWEREKTPDDRRRN